MRIRDQVLTRLSGRLSNSKSLLRRIETLVLSAQFQQLVRSESFGNGGPKLRGIDREDLWRRTLLPILRSVALPVRGLEFGVASGNATRWWLANEDLFARWDGFDTFEGLPTPWLRGRMEVLPAGTFSPMDPDEPFPKVDGACPISWHKGLIADTILPLTRSESELLLVLIDVDLLEPTRDILDWLMTHGRAGDCVYFDEAYDSSNELLALNEAHAKGMKFETLGYTGAALAIRLQ